MTYVNDSKPAVLSIGREFLAGACDKNHRVLLPVMISVLADLLGVTRRAA
ncbi:hypothetical protein LCM27_12385 [Ruegeria marisrubri]|nr:hypothetical protein [Ruegeria marisrubri]MCA0907192.1 hypothetical protein [Ruegeria marisrubri]